MNKIVLFKLLYFHQGIIFTQIILNKIAKLDGFGSYTCILLYRETERERERERERETEGECARGKETQNDLQLKVYASKTTLSNPHCVYSMCAT